MPTNLTTLLIIYSIDVVLIIIAITKYIIVRKGKNRE